MPLRAIGQYYNLYVLLGVVSILQSFLQRIVEVRRLK